MAPLSDTIMVWKKTRRAVRANCLMLCALYTIELVLRLLGIDANKRLRDEFPAARVNFSLLLLACEKPHRDHLFGCMASSSSCSLRANCKELLVKGVAAGGVVMATLGTDTHAPSAPSCYDKKQEPPPAAPNQVPSCQQHFLIP
jgi:hypothetical protein